MRGEQLVILTTNDISGVTRGRAVARADIQEYLNKGVSWVPANSAISAFGPIAPNPWGPMGDLRLLPDPQTEVRVDLWEDASPLHFYLCDIVHPDASPFDSCPRTFLKSALADLRTAGLTVRAAFEHEFHLAHIEDGPGGAFGLDRYRMTEPFGPLVMEALKLARQEPEVFMTEYAPQQFELTTRPAVGLKAADRAVVVREIVREVARRLGNRASFAPVIDPAGTGNGVHIHFSLDDTDLRPMSYDPARPGQTSEIAGRFIAGVLRHLPGFVALTCPSDISYLRLVPDHWSAAFTSFDANNREAAVRICPMIEFAGFDPEPQYHFEFRAADAAASPYIALGTMIRAGLEGIRSNLEPPPLTGGHPGELSEDERSRLGVRRLPTSLEAALQALEADPVVRGWLSPDMLSCFLQLKRFEMGMLEGLDDAAKCRRYAKAY